MTQSGGTENTFFSGTLYKKVGAMLIYAHFKQKAVPLSCNNSKVDPTSVSVSACSKNSIDLCFIQ